MKTKHIFFTAIILLSFTLGGCYDDYFYIEGNGMTETRTLEVDPFTAIHLEGIDDVEISYGAVQEVKVTGDANIIDRVMTDVAGDSWHIRLERGHYRNYELKYYITLPQINAVSNEGVAQVVINDFENRGDLDLAIEGTGNIELNRMENTENLYINIDGLGTVKGFGEFPSLENLDIIISGAGNYTGFPIVTQNCVVDISGTGRCEVSVEDNLDVYIDGAGSVYYKGNPSVRQRISGLGTVMSKN